MDVELANWERFVGSLSAESGAVRDPPCAASIVGAAAIATGVSGVAASGGTSDGPAFAEGASGGDCSVGNAAIGCCVANVAAGGSAGAPVATSADTSVSLGVTSADAMVLLLDGVELVCAPPELCTIPERGSAVGPSLGEEVELVWESTELCTIPERGSAVEPEEDPAAEADEFVADVGPVDAGLVADPDDELKAGDDESDDDESDDDESDDELEELESAGSANATPGVFATAAPTPSATANTPTRTMYCAFTAIPLFLAARPCERQPSVSGLLNRGIALPVDHNRQSVFAVVPLANCPSESILMVRGRAGHLRSPIYKNDLEHASGAFDQALQATLDARRASHFRFAAELPDERWQADFTRRWLDDHSHTEILCWIDDHSRHGVDGTFQAQT